MILSFRTPETEELFVSGQSRRFASITLVATRKLRQLDSALQLKDIASPPGNRLEALHGERSGQYSIRVNDRYRICFRWTEVGPREVEIVDYH